MRELEVRLVEGHNSAAADLFPTRHAEKVLGAFGRAFGVLPDDISSTTKQQKEIIQESVAGLAEEGKVICVRLALFAEMMKGRTWAPSELKDMGGTKGVGVTFLEDTFSSAAASPEHRYHQQAARAVLNSLLPDSGTDIKGHMRSFAELLAVSGYADRPRDFEDLVRVLDSEVRLITPTDPEGIATDHDSTGSIQVGQKYYQLTHDYLVHSIRDWLTRKQKETRRGRAELRLAELTTLWTSRPENRHLPSWWENFSFRWLTEKKKWTEPQRKVMAKAGLLHGFRTAIGVASLAILLAIGVAVRTRVIQQREITRIGVEPLVEELLSGKVTYVMPIRQLLRPSSAQLIEKFRSLMRDEKAEAQQLGAANATPNVIEKLGQIVSTIPSKCLGSVERVPFGQRRSHAAITLLRSGEREKILPVFETTDDPEALTQFIFRCRPRETDPAVNWPRATGQST